MTKYRHWNNMRLARRQIAIYLHLVWFLHGIVIPLSITNSNQYTCIINQRSLCQVFCLCLFSDSYWFSTANNHDYIFSPSIF